MDESGTRLLLRSSARKLKAIQAHIPLSFSFRQFTLSLIASRSCKVKEGLTGVGSPRTRLMPASVVMNSKSERISLASLPKYLFKDSTPLI